MILPYFQDVVRGVEEKLAATRPGEPVARKHLTLELARLGVRLFDGEHRVAWCGIATPYDLLAAMDVTPAFVEFVGASLSSTGMAGPMLDAAEQSGFSTDSCAYHRAVLAADEAGLMPHADLLVGTSLPCSGGLAVIEQIAHRHDWPLMLVHVPPDEGEAARDYLTDQFRAMAEFVAQRTGQSLDPERLRRAVELSNRTRELLVEVYALAGAVPTPARRRDMVNMGITLALLFGREDGVEVARAYRDEFAAKLAARDPHLPKEPIRLMWLQNRIQFRNPVEEILAEEHGALVVADELNDVWWEPLDPDDPIPDMARRCLSTPLMLSARRRSGRIVELARRYAVDAVINPCHWGCRQGTGTRGLIQGALQEHGIPVLNLEVDCVDARQFAEGQIRTRLEAFVEMLLQRRTAGA